MWFCRHAIETDCDVPCAIVRRPFPRAAFPLQRADRTGLGTQVDDTQLIARLDVLRQDHRDLDAAIAALAIVPVPDQLQLARFKKRKLRLRDEIAMLEDQLVPDIIA